MRRTCSATTWKSPSRSWRRLCRPLERRATGIVRAGNAPSGVAQWQSKRLLTARLRVRVSPPELSQFSGYGTQVMLNGGYGSASKKYHALKRTPQNSTPTTNLRSPSGHRPVKRTAKKPMIHATYSPIASTMPKRS